MPDQKIILPALLGKSTIQTKRHLMTYTTAAFFSFSFSILAASIALFLQERFPGNTNAIFFVGLILGFSSIGALFVDSFWSYLQTIRRPRFLLFLALGGLLTTVSIFLFSGVFPILGWTIFTIIAALLYGWSYDLYDITILNTILKRSSPENYAQNISQKKFAEAIGMIFGLMVSGFLLYFQSGVAQFFLLLLLVFVFIFVARNFDRDQDDAVRLEFSQKSLIDWKNVFFLFSHPNELEKILKNAGSHLSEEILSLSRETAEEIKKLPENSKKAAEAIKERARKKLIEILAKENEIVKSEFPETEFEWGAMFRESKEIMMEFFEISRKKRKNLLLWAAIVVIFFSFWDTMAITFQPLFLQKMTANSELLRAFSGVILASFLIPVLLFQMPFAALADRLGRAKFVVLGVFISGISLLFLGSAKSIGVIFLAGMSNSFGYALAFVPAQAMLTHEIEKGQKKKMSTERSAGILRVALNIGNIFGQLGGGIVFAALGFSVGFFVFGILLLLFLVISFVFFFRGNFDQKREEISE